MSFFIFLYFSVMLFLFHSASSRQPLCHDSERSALLRFKESFSIDCKSASSDPSANSKTALWNLEEDMSDCCSWDGVKCNEDTGYVIKLDLNSSCLYGPINSTSTLFNLVHLQWLSLADNNFNDSKIPSEIKNLSNLSHLNLSWSVFSGQMPSEILELSKLESLALDRNDDLELQQPGLESLVQKLTNLRVLDLGGVNISSSLPHVLSLLTDLSSLNFLSLANCELKGNISSSIHNFNNLVHLDLSGNNLQGQIPLEMLELSKLESLALDRNYDLELQQPGIIPSSIGNLTNLVYMDLSSNNFWGELPTSIGNLANLEKLDISGCNFSVPDPSWLNNLTQINYLGLSDNNFTSPISSLSWIGMITKLTYLDLSSNNFIGEIPFWLNNLTTLTYLNMGHNQLTGLIPVWLMNLNHLSTLNLMSNHLIGQIPYQISNLTQLDFLGLSFNQLQSTLELEMFLQLKSLRKLYLSSNRLSLLTNSIVNASSHNFVALRLGSCNLRGFPDFLRNQNQLRELDLSSNNISGQIPGWLLNISENSLIFLNLSHNLLTGFDQQPIVLPWTSLDYLDLRFNSLQRPLPIPPMSTSHYLVSNNKLSGEIPSWLCQLNSLYALDLSNNNLSGKLPKCLGNFSYGLSMLDLQNNKFYGSIPRSFNNGTKLRMIDLSNNLLRGKIPRSLVNCTILEYLDLGNNKIDDTFPSWMGSLTKLEVLNLKSNKLHGVIEEPKSDFVFSKLRMIDLSHNRFIGKFPSKYFQCWNAMKFDNESRLTYMMKENYTNQMYGYSLTVYNKGREIEYVKIANMLTGIWLSSNGFEGEIPATISVLKGLRYLDLSNNNLIGGIPSSLDNLTVLESLVLSGNKLSGEIPQQLVNLTFLAFFNVSYNHLEGPIPQGAQFNTFDIRSYEGNPGLCGQPLSRKCGNSELPHEEEDEGSESPFAFGWKVVAIGYACGMIIGVVLGHIFCTRKHEWFVKIFGMPLKRMERKRGT